MSSYVKKSLTPVHGTTKRFHYYLTNCEIYFAKGQASMFINPDYWLNNKIGFARREMSNRLKEWVEKQSPVAARQKFPIKLNSVYAFPVYSVTEKVFYVGFVNRADCHAIEGLYANKITDEAFDLWSADYIPLFLSTPELYRRSVTKTLSLTEEATMQPNIPSTAEELKPISAKEFLDHANASVEDIPTPRKEPIGFPEFLDIVLFLYTRNQDIINIDACKALGASKFASLPNVRVTADYGVIKTCHEVYNGVINGTIRGVNAGVFERLIYQSPIQTEDDVIEWCNYLMSCFGCESFLVDQSRSPHFQSLVKEHKKTITFKDFHDRKIVMLFHTDKCMLELRVSVDDGTIRHVYYVVSQPTMEIFNDMVESCPTRSSSLGELCNIFQTVFNDRKLEDGYNRRPTGRR